MVGLGRLGKGPLGRVDLGRQLFSKHQYLHLYLVEKIVGIGVLGHAESGLYFVLRAMSPCLLTGFNLSFVQSTLNNTGSKKCNDFLFTLPNSNRTDPIFL